LAGLLCLTLMTACGAVALAARAGSPKVAPLSARALARLKAESRPAGRGPRFRPKVRGAIVGGCRPALGSRYGVHVELFAASRVVPVPRGIGVTGPERLNSGRIVGAGCFGELVTIDPTGLVLVRAGTTPTLGALFAEWGQPLSARRLAGFGARAGRRVAVYVNGRRYRGAPGAIRLVRHVEIALEVGPRVPPHASYDFPPGT
jgi:hypothetical protein